MSARPLRRVSALVGGVLLAVVALTGCTPAVSLEAAADATDPGCAEVIVRLPDTVADQPKRETDAQATGAWGSPASVLLRCGVADTGPTTLPCVDVNGIDWVRDDSDAPIYRFTTFGRTPTTEVIVDQGAVSGTTALVDLTNAVQVVPQTAKCTDISDSFSG
ncbi:DUF3515 domain-containing protein [Cnuibacter physcomitrellae]|uniref:DUF3515 domain-containing protein n=1 Tax=Cnuibacter physcomitrellae TaxID=1619308 RepID=UPI00217608E8|nr:DUF3515 domain-containing protein [Cnuibacter physcomitrellae]MCS5496392.1 DUF3515 domain-containing protein [Cnuibacter physcomitrellae]